MQQINGMLHILKKLNRGIVLSALLLISIHSFSQKDTIQAFYTSYITSNQRLIEYSYYVNALKKNDPQNSKLAFERYKSTFANSKTGERDSAVLIFIRFHKSIEYFTYLEHYAKLFKDYGELNQTLINQEAEKISIYGFKPKYVDGAIITISIVGFVEELFQNLVSEEMKTFLTFNTQLEMVSDTYCEENTHEEYIKVQGNAIVILEKYINNQSGLLKEKLNRYYVDYFAQFTFSDYNPDLCPEYNAFHIQDKKLETVFNQFVKTNSSTKTAQLISFLIENKEKIDFDVLFESMRQKKCPEDLNCDCKNIDFKYKGIETLIDCMIH
ncbi:MAG: hypothetical protein C0599_17270 [Salinivirgaceae bacterium]|nr:MAG: hypothetical protein C0599_17270 [Salinivirgaceae bacterium]